MLLLHLVLLSFAIAKDWVVIYSTETSVTGCKQIASACRFFDYLIMSGVPRENIIYMTPGLSWKNNKKCNYKEDILSKRKNQFPRNIPYSRACWSLVDYIGEYVNLYFLIDVILGKENEVKRLSGKDQVKSDLNSNIVVYYENNIPMLSMANVTFSSSYVLSKETLIVKQLIWFANAYYLPKSLFSATFLKNGCFVANLNHPYRNYSSLAYIEENKNKQGHIVTSGHWDYSWADLIILMSQLTLTHVIMGAATGIVQSNSRMTMVIWGDDSVLDLYVNQLFKNNSMLLRLKNKHTFRFKPDQLRYFIMHLFQQNRRHETLRHYSYKQAMKKLATKQKITWRRAFLSFLPENPSIILSVDACIKDLIHQYYTSCAYGIPFDDSIYLMIQTLCDHRRYGGQLLMAPQLLCGLQSNVSMLF